MAQSPVVNEPMPRERLERIIRFYVKKYPSLSLLAQARDAHHLRSLQNRLQEQVYNQADYVRRPSSVALAAVAAARLDILELEAGKFCQHWNC